MIKVSDRNMIFLGVGIIIGILIMGIPIIKSGGGFVPKFEEMRKELTAHKSMVEETNKKAHTNLQDQLEDLAGEVEYLWEILEPKDVEVVEQSK